MAKNNQQRALEFAKSCQQNYYELLPDWYEYRGSQYHYMKQNIGFALHGPPQITESIGTDNAIALENLQYDAESRAAIDAIYEKILAYGCQVNSDLIQLGIIYNVIFVEEEKNKRDSCNASSSSDASVNGSNKIHCTPIFKIRKHLRGDEAQTWYIDNNARVYKTWSDYMQTNTLPKCTMVVPKNGLYQADPRYPVTNLHSTVWVEIAVSPACKITKKVLTTVDIVSSTLSIGTAVGVGVATLCTPAGPILATAGLLSGTISGLWTIGRCSQQLIDRKKHKESISITSRSAFPAWFGMTTSLLGIGVSNGTLLMTRAIANGAPINTVAKVAFNSIIIGNLTVSGIGVMYQGCSLIEKYYKNRKLDYVDVLLFSSSVLFFSNAVMSTKLAGKLISSSRGSVLEQFKRNLRSKRLDNECARIKASDKKSDSNNTLKTAGIIRKIVNVLNKSDLVSGTSNSSGNITPLIFENFTIRINNMKLLDPIFFVGALLTSTAGIGITEIGLPLICKNSDNVLSALGTSLKMLLQKFQLDDNTFLLLDLPSVADFSSVLDEMKYVRYAKDILPTVFRIAAFIVKNLNDPDGLLVASFRFTWDYLKVNLKEFIRDTQSASTNSEMHRVLLMIATVVDNNLDTLGNHIFDAFYTYMSRSKSLALL